MAPVDCMANTTMLSNKKLMCLYFFLCMADVGTDTSMHKLLLVPKDIIAVIIYAASSCSHIWVNIYMDIAYSIGNFNSS